MNRQTCRERKVKVMLKSLFVISSFLLFSGKVYCQESRTSFEIFLLSDFSSQSYAEYDQTHSYPWVEKITVNGTDVSFGLGSQLVYDLNSYLAIQCGLGFKYTSLDFWFIIPTSSDSRWYFFAEEETSLIHLFTPVSLYFQTLRNRRFRIRPGISFEPNYLIYRNNSLTAYENELFSLISEPEGTPNKLFGIYAADLKCSYEFNNSSEIFITFKLHNIPKYFNEDLGMTSSNLGLMVNIGYKFKPHNK